MFGLPEPRSHVMTRREWFAPLAHATATNAAISANEPSRPSVAILTSVFRFLLQLSATQARNPGEAYSPRPFKFGYSPRISASLSPAPMAPSMTLTPRRSVQRLLAFMASILPADQGGFQVRRWVAEGCIYSDSQPDQQVS